MGWNFHQEQIFLSWIFLNALQVNITFFLIIFAFFCKKKINKKSILDEHCQKKLK